MTRNEFVNYIVKLVKDYRKTATKEPDFFDSVTIAQAIHETGYGASGLYKDYNNAFGYKAKVVNGVPEWDGKVAENYKSDEEIDGVVHEKVESDFRWYDSVEESVADHANMMTRLNGRYLSTYRKAIDAKTPKEQAHALTGSYAGDSRYAKKLIEVMDEWNLYQYDAEKEQDKMAYPKPKMTDRRKQALGYPGHGIYPRRAKTAIKNIVWHFTATARAGNGANIIKSHENFWKNTHGWDIGGYHYYIDRQGNIFWNYDLEIATYGAGKANPYSMHISLEASSVSNYTAAQIKAREDLTLWLITSELPHLGGNSMRGHKEMPGNSTSCPGYSVAQLNEFRKGLSRKADQDWNGAETDKDDITVSKSGKYTVNHGDTLWAIAQAHGQTVAQLQEWNGIADGQWLKTGQVVYVTAPKQNSYTVKKGDSLWSIGQMHDVTVDQIKEWNDLKTNLIYSGQELFVSDPDAKNVKDPEPEQEVEKVEEQPKEDNPKVPAIELKENQLMDWKGNIYARISK